MPALAARAWPPLLLLAATAAFAVGVGIEKAEEGEHGGRHEEAILGLEAESTPLVLLAVAASLLLVVALWRRPSAPRALCAAAAFCGVFAVLDVIEVVRKLDAGEAGIAALAALAAVLHAAVAALALLRFRSGRRAARAPTM